MARPCRLLLHPERAVPRIIARQADVERDEVGKRLLAPKLALMPAVVLRLCWHGARVSRDNLLASRTHLQGCGLRYHKATIICILPLGHGRCVEDFNVGRGHLHWQVGEALRVRVHASCHGRRCQSLRLGGDFLAVLPFDDLDQVGDVLEHLGN